MFIMMTITVIAINMFPIPESLKNYFVTLNSHFYNIFFFLLSIFLFFVSKYFQLKFLLSIFFRVSQLFIKRSFNIIKKPFPLSTICANVSALKYFNSFSIVKVEAFSGLSQNLYFLPVSDVTLYLGSNSEIQS